MENSDYKIPLYIQLEGLLIKKIEDGEYLPGEKILSERQMSEQYGINRMTVKTAVNALVKRGYLIRIQGKGTFVKKNDSMKFDLGFFNNVGNSGISALLKNNNIQVSNVVIAKGICQDTYLSKKLILKEKEDIYALHRVRKGDGDPFAVEYSYMPQKYFEDIDEFNFENISLYDYMESRNHMPCQFSQRLILITAGEKEARFMQINPGEPVYFFEYIGEDNNGLVVEYTESYMNPAKIEFKLQGNI